MLVHELAHFDYAGFEYPVGTGVGDHQGGQLVAVLFGFFAQVVDVDIAHCVALHDHHLHTGHDGAGGVRAVGAFGDDGDVAVPFPPVLVVGADDEQTGIFPTGAAIGLQATGGEAGDFRQIPLQFAEQLLIALGLSDRREGMQIGKFSPANGYKLRGRIQLHRTRPQRDHTVHQAQVLVLQSLQVAHQFRFRAVVAEVGMRQVLAVAAERGCGAVGNSGDAPFVGQFRPPVVEVGFEDAADGLEVSGGYGLVKTDADAARFGVEEVVALPFGPPADVGDLFRRSFNVQGIEKVIGGKGEPCPAQGIRQDDGKVVGTQGNGLQALRPVVAGVHGGHIGEQGLGGADVGGGLFAADVLLAGLQGHAQGGVAVAVLTDPDDATGDEPLVSFLHGEVGGVRPPVSHRYAEALGTAHYGIGAPFAGRRQQRQGQQVGGYGDGDLSFARPPDEFAVIFDAPIGPGVL